MNTLITLDQLNLKKEKTYFTIVAVIAGICWLLVAISLIGIIYGLLIALFLWLANGLIIARFESESVLVTEQQMPVLHRTYLEVVATLELGQIPPLYIVQAHGVLNAFARRWSGRHFVIVYSDMLEACGEDTAHIRFLLGHELGHVRSNHLLKKVLLAPGLLFPLIGSAYSRTCEGTCDRYGGYASGDLHAAAQAMLILAGGKRAWQAMDPEVFARQYKQERGFFVSWHELTSGYPTLSQRTHNLLTMDVSLQPVGEPRHPLAYLFALFSPGGRQGTAGNMLVTIAVVAMLFAIAMPAVQRARLKALQAHELHASAMGAVPFTAPPIPIGPAAGGPVAGDSESAVMQSLVFSSAVGVGNQPVDNLDRIPATLRSLFVCIDWKLDPGPHEITIVVSDGSGRTLEMAHSRFTAPESSWRSKSKINVEGIRPRPSEFVFTISLDSKEMATRQLAADVPP